MIQRAADASVSVDGKVTGSISRGLMVLVGVENGDTPDDAKWLAAKTAALRIFDDADGVMNLAVTDVPDAGILAISQFTLTASTRKGNRPSYIRAAGHDLAVPLYELYCAEAERLLGRPTQRGVFGADMQVKFTNSGPVTIIIDSRLRE